MTHASVLCWTGEARFTGTADLHRAECLVRIWYNSYTAMRFEFDARKSRRLRASPRRGIGFEEAREIFSHPYFLDNRTEVEQHRAIGWVGGRLYTVIFEIREYAEGEYYRLVTLWRATRQEQQLYEENF